MVQSERNLSAKDMKNREIWGKREMKNSALVVIDLQNDITKNYREIIDRVNQAIDWAAGREMHVV